MEVALTNAFHTYEDTSPGKVLDEGRPYQHLNMSSPLLEEFRRLNEKDIVRNCLLMETCRGEIHRICVILVTSQNAL